MHSPWADEKKVKQKKNRVEIRNTFFTAFLLKIIV